MVANTVGDVLSERVPTVNPRSNDAINATLWEPARVPKEPSSPNPLRDGLITLVSGLLLCVGLALALPRIVASGIGRAAIRAMGAARRPVGESRGVSAMLSTAEAAKEKELLEALARRGALTVAGATLETSLTVEEADRTLSALAAKATSRSPSSTADCCTLFGSATLPYRGSAISRTRPSGGLFTRVRGR